MNYHIVYKQNDEWFSAVFNYKQFDDFIKHAEIHSIEFKVLPFTNLVTPNGHWK